MKRKLKLLANIDQRKGKIFKTRVNYLKLSTNIGKVCQININLPNEGEISKIIRKFPK